VSEKLDGAMAEVEGNLDLTGLVVQRDINGVL
jgi:hypothetical protein